MLPDRFMRLLSSPDKRDKRGTKGCKSERFRWSMPLSKLRVSGDNMPRPHKPPTSPIVRFMSVLRLFHSDTTAVPVNCSWFLRTVARACSMVMTESRIVPFTSIPVKVSLPLFKIAVLFSIASRPSKQGYRIVPSHLKSSVPRPDSFRFSSQNGSRLARSSFEIFSEP